MLRRVAGMRSVPAIPVVLGASLALTVLHERRRLASCLAVTQRLIEERGKSLTLGVVLEPSFIPGLSLTVDYYEIKVKI